MYIKPLFISATDARSRWADVFSRAVQERWPVPIERGGDEHGLLIGFDELELLIDRFRFEPDAFFEADAVSLWLPELALYGRGASFEEAQADLVDEVRVYVEEYLADARLYLRAPNRAEHFPYVLRAFVADAAGRLADVLFAPPVASPVAPEPVAAA